MASTQLSRTGFDTSLPGTPQSCWETLELIPWQPLHRSLIVVAPHPDDETLGAGGLIHQYAHHQLRITLISVTDGEAACPEIHDLATLRHSELRHALRTLSAERADIVRLGIPDGRVAEHRTPLADALSSLASQDSLIVAPFERDGHADHEAVGEVARQIACERGFSLATYPIWAWHQATPEVFAGRSIARLSLSAAARAAKRDALRCYTSQLRERPGGPIVPPHVLAYFDRPYEAFVL